MYTSIYNRLCGWAFFALGTVGFVSGKFGNYMRITFAESMLCLIVGLSGMVGARLRHRDCTLLAAFLGIALFIWGIAGFVWPTNWLGTSEPLENAVRIVGGVWGMYTSVTDVLAWRTSLIKST